MWPRISELEQRANDFMDRLRVAGQDHGKRAAVLEEYLRFAYAHIDEDQFDVGAWSETLAESYLALGRVDDAVRVIEKATREGCSEGAEMLSGLAEQLMRSGHEARARPLWEQARSLFPDDVWVYVQAGIEYSDLGDHATALMWLTPGTEWALRTGDVESALEQLVPLRAGCLSALGRGPDDLQVRAGRAR
jgi:tetratricopeptide (TPR) repeat protein